MTALILMENPKKDPRGRKKAFKRLHKSTEQNTHKFIRILINLMEDLAPNSGL